ncbi:transglutaminase-like domain-containing protein [Teredinibacter franksiae]|uniref:transglutaminase-like domain-containing protein n=1 Tax=Teredinibacter franksiae TaxID=2761453 RepID=UPI00162971B4|nr:transglutaminase family protein [Teredinibacter franksiae]
MNMASYLYMGVMLSISVLSLPSSAAPIETPESSVEGSALETVGVFTPARTTLDLSLVPTVDDTELLSINDEVKSILDRVIAPLHTKREKAVELQRLLFQPMFLGITYDINETKTAQQTFDSGTGNCLSHASLYLAAARHLGLRAHFQSVEVPREWLNRDDFYLVPGHVNVAVLIPGNTITVEFTNAYSARKTQLLKSQPLTDKQALAEYYNNIGMQYMEEREYLKAIAYMRKATETYKKTSSAWSNLGVTYKINGHLDLAEIAYEKALKYDKRNLSVINNIYILYIQTNNIEKANKLAKRVARYSKKNPYYLSKLAQTDIALGNYDRAIISLKKAIRIKQSEPKFYLSLAYAYHQSGRFEKSIDAVIKAQAYAASKNDLNRYQAKLEYLKRYHAGL